MMAITSSKTLRVAVAGLGVGSTQVLPAMEKMPGIEIKAAADVRLSLIHI